MKNEIWIHSHTKSVNEVVDTINIEHLLPAPQVLTLSHPWQDFNALTFYVSKIILVEYQSFWTGPISFGQVQIILDRSKFKKLV